MDSQNFTKRLIPFYLGENLSIWVKNKLRKNILYKVQTNRRKTVLNQMLG